MRLRKVFFVCLLGGFLTGALAAQDFPKRNIEIIYPWSPGNAMAVSQIVGDALGKELGVAVSVVATPGAVGTKAFATALGRPADGYTIIDGYVAPLVMQPILGNADWTYRDFTPLWASTSNPFAIVSRPNEKRWKDMKGLMEYMRDHRGKLRYGSGNIGTLPQVMMAKLSKDYNVLARPVPYGELSLNIKDFRSGLLDFTIVNPSTYLTYKKYLRIEAVMSELKWVSDFYGGAPRLTDFGYDMGVTGLTPMGWTWWLVKKGTPPDVVKTLRDAMQAALERPDVQEKLKRTGFVPLHYSPDQYEKVVGAVDKQFRPVLDAVKWEQEELEKVSK